MANKIGAIKVYSWGVAREVASIYDSAAAGNNLVIRHGGANCYVPLAAGQSSGRLAFAHDGANYVAASPIAGRKWYARATGDNVWGWLASDSSGAKAGEVDASDTNVTIWVTGASGVSGDTDTAILTLAGGKTVSDVTVTGNAAQIYFVVAGKDYRVASGKLVRAVPASSAVVNKLQRGDGKIISQTIPYVNPDAADSAVAEAVAALNSLSANAGKGMFRANRQKN